MKPSIKAAIIFPALLVAVSLGGFAFFQADSTPPWRSSAASDQSQVTNKRRDPTKNDQLVPFIFVSYNVKNWLVSKQSPTKKPEAKEAVIQILAGTRPDVIGLSEIGSKEDIKEIQLLLKDAGHDLPHTYHTGGVDTVRHLAILSRFPIVATEAPSLEIQGKGYSMQRGILDATIEIGSEKIRFIGLHLKSKRNVPEFDQALLRIDEATHARQHIDGILAEDPGAMIVCYGDFNDTTRSLSTRAIYGTYRTPGYMSPVHVNDSRGESWTHCWAYQDIYSRIDFVTVSKAIKRRVDKNSSRIVDDGNWETASDHRPVLVRFK